MNQTVKIMQIDMSYIDLDIINCARCGENHPIRFYQFKHNPIRAADGTTWTHWGACDKLNEPVLLSIKTNPDKSASLLVIEMSTQNVQE